MDGDLGTKPPLIDHLQDCQVMDGDLGTTPPLTDDLQYCQVLSLQ